LLRRPTAQRPWQHVLEPLSGYLLLAAALETDQDGAASAWNFGPIDIEPLLVRDLARQFVNTWGHGSIIEMNADSALHEAHYLKLDSSKATAELGWRPLFSGQERLQWTVDWYKSWKNDPEMIWEYTIHQIQAAEKKIAALGTLARTWNGDLVNSQAA
jgi:CDP-glucose 4,6-dehydratase